MSPMPVIFHVNVIPNVVVPPIHICDDIALEDGFAKFDWLCATIM